MSVEPLTLRRSMVNGAHGKDCALDPDASPAGDTIRVLFDAPFLGLDEDRGALVNTRPQAYALPEDVDGVVTPELTVLRLEGQDYTTNRLEPVEGGGWRLLVLNKVP